MKDLASEIKPFFLKEGSVGAHGFDHALRVYNLGQYIAIQENADLEIVGAACLLHDIGRERGEEKDNHEKIGADIAREVLREIDFPKNKIESVVQCILVHRYSKGIKPEFKEDKIVQDADRLEEIGAIAIARGLIEDMKKGKPLHDPDIPANSEYKSGGNKTSVNFLKEKSLKLKPETFHTFTAQELAKERYNFTKQFVDRVIEEWNFESNSFLESP